MIMANFITEHKNMTLVHSGPHALKFSEIANNEQGNTHSGELNSPPGEWIVRCT